MTSTVLPGDRVLIELLPHAQYPFDQAATVTSYHGTVDAADTFGVRIDRPGTGTDDDHAFGLVDAPVIVPWANVRVIILQEERWSPGAFRGSTARIDEEDRELSELNGQVFLNHGEPRGGALGPPGGPRAGIVVAARRAEYATA